MGTRVLAACVALAVSGGGCSWAFMTSPPARSTFGDPVACTSSKAAPILDTLCASYFLLNTASIAARPKCDASGWSQDPDCLEAGTRSAAMGLALGIAGLCAASAVSGYSSASRCNLMKGGWTSAEPVDRPSGWTPRPEPPDPQPAIPPSR
jgi:hypothetical protein